MITKDYTVAYWSDLLDQYAPGLPKERLNAWMAVESQGFPQALGSRYEVGIFQIDLQDGPAWGASTDTLHTNFCAGPSSSVRTRDLTDDEEALQVTSGNDYISSLWMTSHNQTEGLGWSDDDVWCLTKLHHALPALASTAWADAKSKGQVGDWGAFRAYVESLPPNTYTGGWDVPGHYYPFARFFNNAEKIGKLGLADQVGSSSLVLLVALGFVAWLLSRLVG